MWAGAERKADPVLRGIRKDTNLSDERFARN